MLAIFCCIVSSENWFLLSIGQFLDADYFWSVVKFKRVENVILPSAVRMLAYNLSVPCMVL